MSYAEEITKESSARQNRDIYIYIYIYFRNYLALLKGKIQICYDR